MNPETVSNALLAILGVLVAIGLAAFWPIPVKAQDCYTVDMLAADATEAGDRVVATVTGIRGVNTDTMVIIESREFGPRDASLRAPTKPR